MGRIRVFAGPNGSGKSTLFHQLQHTFNTGVFVNADIIEQQIGRSGLIDLAAYGIKSSEEEFEQFKTSAEAASLIKKAASEKLDIDLGLRENFIVDKSKSSHSYESALAALFIRHLLVAKNKTFSYETVMSHRSKIAELAAARESGYRNYLYFVCTDDPSVNIQRVENRVEKGGHDVLDDKISSRYYKTLDNLFDVIKVCYRTYLFDNSGATMILVGEIFADKLTMYTSQVPNWVQQYVLKHFVQ